MAKRAYHTFHVRENCSLQGSWPGSSELLSSSTLSRLRTRSTSWLEPGVTRDRGHESPIRGIFCLFVVPSLVLLVPAAARGAECGGLWRSSPNWPFHGRLWSAGTGASTIRPCSRIRLTVLHLFRLQTLPNCPYGLFLNPPLGRCTCGTNLGHRAIKVILDACRLCSWRGATCPRVFLLAPSCQCLQRLW